jgi:hypothetical protein
MARASRQALAEILDASRSADPEVGRTAVRELCPCKVKTNVPDVRDRILEMTRDPNLRVRKNALHDMLDGSPRARQADIVAALEQMRNDPDPKLRRNVRKTLARHRRTGKVNIAAR